MLKPGDRLPALALQDETGATRTLADLARPKGLVLYVYPKDNTPGCTLEGQEFTALVAKLRGLGWEVAGLSMDSVKSHCSFIEKQGLGVTLLSDPQGSFIEALGAFGEKKVAGKVAQGILRTTFVVGGDGKVLKVYPQVKAAGHAEQVLADLQAL